MKDSTKRARAQIKRGDKVVLIGSFDRGREAVVVGLSMAHSGHWEVRATDGKPFGGRMRVEQIAVAAKDLMKVDDGFAPMLQSVTSPTKPSAASLWWSSLGDEERELVHGRFENRKIERGAEVPKAHRPPLWMQRWARLEAGERLLLTAAINAAREFYEDELEAGHTDIAAGIQAYRRLRTTPENV